MRRALLTATLLLAVSIAPAEAVTARDIINLSRAGLGEEVLLALVEVDGGVFSIDTATLTELKKAGVSERVIEAMIRSGRSRPVPEPGPSPVLAAEPAPPQVVVIEHEVPVVQHVPVAVPVYYPVVTVERGRRVRTHYPATQYRVGSQPVDPSPGFGAHPPAQPSPKKAAPVYWGWGGKLRPDAWKPAPDPHDKPAPKGKPSGGSR